jgi:hypothetical protein
MGLVCNNVLHDRAGFVDDALQPRLLYRARYLDRVRAAEAGGIGESLAIAADKLASSPGKQGTYSY